MKQFSTKISIFIIYLLGIFSIVSCIDETAEKPVNEFIVQVNMPSGFNKSVFYANQSVILKSQRTQYMVLSDSNGKAVFNNIIPDIYSISTTWEIEGEDYIEMADTVVENKNIVLSGSVSKEQIFTERAIVLSLSKSTKQSLIISKIYASGTKDNNNKNYISDKYIEIFNNSDEIQILDTTIYIGLVESESVIAFPAATNPGFVYARQVFRFPASESGHSILPGKSIVIANSAIDHTQFSPNSVNLLNADYEAKSPTYSNNSSVKELDLIYTAYASLVYLNLVNGGDNGLFLFKSTENVKDFPIFYIPGKQNGNRYMQIPINLVFDGVETLRNKSTTGPDINTKRIQSFVDAGYMFITATSGYTHESIERRIDVKKSTAERYYLIDSNNSLNDFRTVTDPTPRKYDKALLMGN